MTIYSSSQHFLLQCTLMMPGRSAHYVVAQALASLGQLYLCCDHVSARTGALHVHDPFISKDVSALT